MTICFGLGKKVRIVVRRRDLAASKAEVVLDDIVLVAWWKWSAGGGRYAQGQDCVYCAARVV